MGRMAISRSTVRQSLMLEAKPARAAATSTMAKPNSKIAYGAIQPAMPVRSSSNPKIAARKRSSQAMDQSPK